MANEFVARNGIIAKDNSTITGTLAVSGNITMGGVIVATKTWVTDTALTGYATESYVTTAINNLIDSAPGALNTLNELAAALGDDPNFVTTITTSIGTKVSKAGDTMTGNINWGTTDRGLTWSMNTDGAYIKFFNTGDGDTNSRLEYGTSDNGNEFHRWMVSTGEEMTLKSDGLRVTDSIWMGGNLVATQSWVNSQNYLTTVPDEYLTETEGDALYAPISHTHAATDITSGTLAAARLSGNYAINVTGSAATLTTARTLTIGNTGKTFNGSANVSWTLSEIGAASSSHTHNVWDLAVNRTLINIDTTGSDNFWQYIHGVQTTDGTHPGSYTYIASFGDRSQGIQFSHGFGNTADSLFFRAGTDNPASENGAGVYTTWRQIASRPWVTSQNYITASASITGNAATATTLQTARTLTIGNTGKTFNGSANVSWSLAEIGAQPAGSYLLTTGGTLSASKSHTTGTISSADAILNLYNNWQSNTDEKGAIITFSDNYFDGTNYNQTTRAAIKGGTDTTGNTADGFLAFYTDSAGGNSAEERMRIDKNGNVGIGTTSPDAPLTVHSSTDPEIRFGYSSTQDHRIQWDSSKVFIHADPENANASSAIALYVDGGAKLYIPDSGNVGIGKTNPATTLDVNGVTTANGLIISGGAAVEDAINITNGRLTLGGHNNGAGVWYEDIAGASEWFVGLSSDDVNYRFYNAPAATDRVVIYANGTVQFNAYGAGLLRTTANGSITVDTNTYLTGITAAQVHGAIYTTGGDANTYTTFGIYRNYAVNGPIGGHNTILNVMQADGNYGFQLGADTTSSADGLYFRSKDATIGTWKQVASRQWVTAQGYATTGYVDTAIANLVDTAPDALNTLNELATALGDDPNFATTVTNSISGKVSKSGDTMTGTLTLSYVYPRINLYDTNNDSDYSIINDDGTFSIYDVTNNSHRLRISAAGNVTLVGTITASNFSGTSSGTNTGDQTTISGNAGSATVLQTARTLTIGNTGKSFNGSANVAWTLAEIGAAAASHTHDDRYYTETEVNTFLSGKLSTSGGTLTGAITGTKATFISDFTAGTNALNILGATNGLGTGITFSDNGTPAASDSGQNGYITYYHGDGSSYGSGNVFVLSSSETTMTILADGKLMYKEGIYSKPTSGTGAGTRKDVNWDTAYGWGDHDGLYASIATEQNLVDLTNSLGTAAYQDSTAFAAASHTHTIANVTGLQTELNNKAPLASPALTGTPTAPTAAISTNTTQIATTAFVKNQGYLTSYAETDTLATVTGRGNTANSRIIINSTGTAGVPTLSVNTSTSSTFVHSQENLAANLTAGQHNIIVVGKTGNTKNSGYIGYYWAGAASNSNFVTIGHWGADDLFRVYGDGRATVGTNTVWHAGNDGAGSGLDADLLDGQQGSYYLDWTNVTNKPDPTITLAGAVTGAATMTDLGNITITTTATSDPTLTLNGDVSGSATFTNLGNATLTVTVANNSHEHSSLYENSVIDFGSSKLQWTDQPGLGGTGLDGAAPRNPVDGWYHNLIMNHANSAGYYSQIATGLNTSDIYFSRVQAGSPQAWQRIFADDYHPNADKWTTARTLSLTGAVTGSASIDGSGNVSIATTATADPTLTLAGDASGSATFTNLGNATLTVTVVDDSHTHDGRYYTETESDARFVNVTGDTVTGDLTVSGAALGVISTTAGSDAFYVDGVNGRLFTVTDSLDDSLFSVNTVAGLPVIEAFADNTVNLGPFTNPVTISSTGTLSIGGLQAATQSYVDTAITNLIGGAPGALDTLNELAAAINDDASYASTITSALALKAPLASPALTGTPTAPTAATATNTTQIATTAFVKAQGYSTTTGTVTSVSGTGSYGGLTLSGTVTSSGNITLGGTPTGTWPISVSGNAATATSATTATSAATWTTARNLTIGNTAKSVNGSANVSWTLAEIGAQAAGSYAAASHTHTSLNSVNFNNGDLTNINSIQIGDPGPGEGLIFNGGNGWKIYESPNDLTTNTGGNLQFVKGTTRVMTLDTSNNVYFLGSITASGGNSTNWNTAYGWGNHADYGYWNTDLVDAKNVQSAEVVFAGNVTVEGTFTESSSIRFKENIVDLESSTEKVEQLRPVRYNKIGVEEEEIGLIAEEVAEIYPEVVTYNEEGQPSGVNYTRLSVILLKSVQELAERINKLENK